eukprot:TRINITY_DN6039_c1_g1_i1.p1 TRINITY_DN6039_c1_g1~~TRINITY_DN6039_c1_g1_i1.p1  ORF type:complete len:90 (+),score=8.25 TRINITY_DN6039_c1_g1_i1:114-383(+)
MHPRSYDIPCVHLHFPPMWTDNDTRPKPQVSKCTFRPLGEQNSSHHVKSTDFLNKEHSLHSQKHPELYSKRRLDFQMAKIDVQSHFVRL